MVEQYNPPVQNYPTYDPQTGQPYSQMNTTSLIESQDSKLIEWILNPENILRQLDNTLRGIRIEKKWNEDLNEFTEEIIIDRNPMMNEQGIKSVMRIVRGYVQNPVFSTTTMEETNIIEITLVFGETFVKQTSLCIDIWELSYEDYEMLNNLVDDIIYATLLRSKNGHLIEYITQSYSEKYIGSNMGGQGGMPRRKGVLGKWFGW